LSQWIISCILPPTRTFLFAKEGNQMVRHRLTEEQWLLIADIFPQPAKTGRPPSDRRMVVDAILWILRAGAPWRDLPEEFGPWETVYGLFNAWTASGLWDKILHCLQAAQADAGKIDQKLWCIDGTIVRAHRCAGGGGKKTILRNRMTTH
jgi:transposase